MPKSMKFVNTKYPLNFKLGEPTNGHVYEPDMFEAALIKSMNKAGGLMITRNAPDTLAVDLSSVIGHITSYEINENNVTFTGRILKEYGTPLTVLTTAGVGTLTEDNMIEDFELLSVYPIPTDIAVKG